MYAYVPVFASKGAGLYNTVSQTRYRVILCQGFVIIISSSLWLHKPLPLPIQLDFKRCTTNDKWTDAQLMAILMMEGAKTGKELDICPSSSFFYKNVPFQGIISGHKVSEDMSPPRGIECHNRHLTEACLPFYITLQVSLYQFSCLLIMIGL